MNDYFDGAVRQLLRRAENLLTRIKPGLPSEFHLLEQNCRQKIVSLMAELAELIHSPKMLAPENQTVRIRTYQRLSCRLDEIETVVIPVLSRSHEDDRFLNRLVQQIRGEINYPLLPPIVSPFSQSYFYILGDYNLICVHLEEGNFLLHLPDIYHEMAHPLEWESGYPSIRGFQISLIEFLDEVKSWLNGELQKETRRRGPDVYKFYIERWKKSWENWGREFFCDLFAVFTLGPAYVWSHFHLCATRAGNPFEVSLLTVSTHPPDDARMRVMLDALCLTGFDSEAANIETRWEEFINLLGVQPEPEYNRCFPKYITKLLLEKALTGIKAMNCRIAVPETDDPVHKALNDAWKLFWSNPTEFSSEEKQMIEVLKTHINNF
jgi:hypothetical protein